MRRLAVPVARWGMLARVGPAPPAPPHRTPGHQLDERRLLVPLPRGQREDERPARAVAAEVDVAGEAAARAPEGLALLPPFAPAA